MMLNRNKNSNRPTDYDARLAALRVELKKNEVDAFFLPLADEFHGEYMPASSRRLEWLTGFTGSAGSALIFTNPETASAFLTDGRYRLQAETELPATYRRYDSGEHSVESLVKMALETIPPSVEFRLGYDPSLLTKAALERWHRAFAGTRVHPTPLEHHPIEALWHDRPAQPATPVHLHPLDHAGVSSAEKRSEISKALALQKTDAAFLTLGDSIMWLLNIRGSDVPMTPFALCHALVHVDESVDLFIARESVSAQLEEALGQQIRVHPLVARDDILRGYADRGLKVLCDPAHTSQKIWQIFEQHGGKVISGDDPCQLPKACKNQAEIAGTRAAHGRDGLAVTRFIRWLQESVCKEALDELRVMETLEAFRAQAPEYRGPSFTTIAGFGPNGAIVHYRATEATNRTLAADNLLLLDSGGQYADGTTDITRTLSLGAPTRQMQEDFTLVLKGHIALGNASFPKGTSGIQLDALARNALWQAGKDYDHGTGHGVGSYLSVHEGPQRISKKGSAIALQPGMILSNEPGFYRQDAYGIRIESLVVVEPHPQFDFFYHFSTLTCVPIDRMLVVREWLTEIERKWLDGYHRWVMETHALYLTPDEKEWLERQCRPI